MRKTLIAALVTATLAPAALTATATSAEAGTVVRKPSAHVTVSPYCQWNTGHTVFRVQLNNAASNIWTQFAVTRKNDAKAPGTKFINVAADHREPVFGSIRTGESVRMIVKAPQLPAGKRLLLDKTFKAIDGCKLYKHNPTATISETGAVSLVNKGDFIEHYTVSWQNGGNGTYEVKVAAGETIPFQPFVHGETAISVYVDGDRLLTERIVTAAE